MGCFRPTGRWSAEETTVGVEKWEHEPRPWGGPGRIDNGDVGAVGVVVLRPGWDAFPELYVGCSRGGHGNTDSVPGVDVFCFLRRLAQVVSLFSRHNTSAAFHARVALPNNEVSQCRWIRQHGGCI